MNKPKILKVEKPVKLIFTGGFLGSGKTTALAELAKRLINKGKRVGIITNDQSGNLTDTLIVRQMLDTLNVPVQEVVKGCFCCKFDELIDEMEKILQHNPDILMGEPVGSCTDFVAAVAHPIKIHYRDAFIFSPFSTMVDPDRVRELFLSETETTFPDEVAYLFHKQLEEADLIVLNKIDQVDETEQRRLANKLKQAFPDKTILAVSAKTGWGMDPWLDILLSQRPGAGTVLREIDYDRYAAAEAVLGWLNAAITLTASSVVSSQKLLTDLMRRLQRAFKESDAGIGHLKCALTSKGKSIWINLTGIDAKTSVNGITSQEIQSGTLLINARVKMEPERLEAIVRDTLKEVSLLFGIEVTIVDLQCFSPAYPTPPYLVRDGGAQ